MNSFSWPKASRLGRFAARCSRFLRNTIALLRIPAPDAPQLYQRIRIMERDIVLPLKAAAIGMLLYSFYLSPAPWIGAALGALDIAVESTQYLLGIYIILNVIVGGLLLAMNRAPLALVEWAVFTIGLVDGIFLSALTLVTGGFDSILYWVFLGCIVRSAISVPRATSQLTLNLTLTVCYTMAVIIEIAVAKNLEMAAAASPEETGRHWLELTEDPTESLALRLLALLLMTLCCYAVQLFLERHRQALEQAREFALREGQLQSAGRLAAEFAHQIKNPLAIINNAAFSVRRALEHGRGGVADQVRIIQEEVERCDRIITQIMGYAQLSEGRVEKLNVTEEIDRAIEQVFPPAVDYGVRIEREYGPSFPPLLMQRRHLGDVFVNLLQNAREALAGRKGVITIQAECREDYTIEVSIADDGPGIPADQHTRIFEAYHTTKEKGTGLGLATVRHNAELYGGGVRVESELGKGARFVVTFPARTLMKLGPHR